MNQDFRQIYKVGDSVAVDSATRNRVLRNTYWLLAISMIPTILGAWLGVQIGFSFFTGSPMLGFLLFMGIAFGFFYAIEKTKESAIGVLILLGFTFFMGLMLSRMIGLVLHSFTNGAELITIAFGGTAAIFAVMATVATVAKTDFSSLSKWLLAGVLVLIVASLLNVFLHLTALSLVVSVAAIGIFSAYILYDVQKVVNGGETNYIVATLNIYLDVYNIFVNLLRLLSYFAGNRD